MRRSHAGRLATLGALAALTHPAAAQGMYDVAAFRTFEITFPTSGWLQPLIDSKRTEQYLRADLKFAGKTYKDIGVRARGASSFNAGVRNGKLPLKISFDEFVPGRRVLGVRSTILNNGYWSPTFMREVLTLEMMREFVPAPEANFARVVINGSYRGVYIHVETPNKDFLARHFDDADGNRYTGQTALQYRGAAPSLYPRYYPLVSSPVPNAYQDLIDALRTTTFTGQQAFDEIPKLCNVEGGLKVQALNVAFANGDSFPRHNYYIYMDPLHRQMEAIPWDTNLSFRRTTITTYPTFYGHTDLWRRWFEAHLRDIAETGLDWSVLGKKVATWQAMIDQAVRDDPLKFYTYADFKNGITQRTINIFPFGLKQSVEGLRSTILAIFTGPRVALTGHRRTPAVPTPLDDVWINVTAKSAGAGVRGVNLHWRNVGRYRSIPMFDDGQHRDGRAGDGVFGVMVPFKNAFARVDYYFSAEENNRNISFLPIQTDHRPFRYTHLGPRQTSVLLHEVMARNTAGIKDEQGEFEDWIELHNPTAQPVDVSGMYLSDDRGDLTKWKIPPGLTIQPGDSFVIWADNEPLDGPFHATFKLGAGGEEVYLTDKNGTDLLDFIAFGPQLENVSQARLRDRPHAPWVTDFTPTPSSRNELRGCGTRRFAAADHTAQEIALDLTGTPKIGTTVSLDLSGAPANRPVALLVGLGVAATPFQPLGIHLLVDGVGLTVTLPGSATGALSLPASIPNDPTLAGARVVLQGLADDGGRVVDSNALQLEVCR